MASHDRRPYPKVVVVAIQKLRIAAYIAEGQASEASCFAPAQRYA